jgi:hypothetical protein
MFSSEINAVEGFRGGVNIGRDSTASIARRMGARTMPRVPLAFLVLGHPFGWRSQTC